MSTIFQKFPGLSLDSSLETKARIYPVSSVFTAALAGGFFVWDKVRVKILSVSASDLIVMDGVTLCSNIDQLQFSRALVGLFDLGVVRGGNGQRVNLAPFKFGAFNQGENFSANWVPTATEGNLEEIFFELSGRLEQTQELVNLNSIQIIATSSVYLCKQGMLNG